MPRIFSRLAWACSLFCVTVFSSAAVQRTPPSVYEAQIAPLLTPAAEALANRDSVEITNGSNASILLREIVHFEADDGTWYRVLHDIYFAHNDSAQSSIGSRTYSYDKDRETIVLIAALTHRDDGTKQAVEEQGAFLQAPQYQAASDLYTSQEELNLIFPSVKGGVATESIVLIHEDQPVWSGQFAARFTFDSFWPSRWSRLVVEASSETTERLKSRQNSTQIVTHDEVAAESGRRRHVWQTKNRAALNWEEESPSPEFFAPTVWLTTVEQWGDVAVWFSELLAGRSELGPELLKQMDEWIDEGADRDTTVATLFEHVANDVRYTGLEFGLAGYQPYTCDEVWANRYGDCKDKANLLRSMLAEWGITSHLALVKTTGHGLVNRGSPSWNQFNHAIVALPRETGGYDLLDPTVELAAAKDQNQSISDRDVFVVTSDGGEWYRAEEMAEQHIETHGDLKLSGDGSLNGWFTLSATGISAAHYATYYNQWDDSNIRLIFAGLVEEFLPGVDVIDVDYTPQEKAVSEFSLKAFIARGSGLSEADSLGSFRFPMSVSWLPNVSTQEVRKRAYRSDRITYRHRGQVVLPAGFGPVSLPASFAANSATARFEASWRQEGNILYYDLTQQSLKTTLGPDDYAIYQRSVRSLLHWLEQPISFQREANAGADSGETANVAEATDDELDGFPILSTGEGQLALLESLYPEGHDDSRRRMALRQTLQWFPDDVETVFTASLYLLQLNAGEQWTLEQVSRLSDLLERYGSHLARANRTWGEFVQAQARWSVSQDLQAVLDLKKLAEDADNDSYRRGWSAYMAGIYMAENDPRGAVEYLLDYAAFDSEARPTINAEICTRMLTADAADLIPKWLDNLRILYPEDFQTTVASALLQVVLLSDSMDLEQITPFVVSVRTALTTEELESQSTEFGIVMAMDAFERLEVMRGGWARVYVLVEELCEDPPLEWIDYGDAETIDSAVAAYRAVGAENIGQRPRELINAGLNQLMYHRDNALVSAYVLMRMMWVLGDNTDGNESLVDPLIEIVMAAPTQFFPNVIEARNQVGLALSGLDRNEEALAVFEQQFEQPGITSYQQAETHGRLIETSRYMSRAEPMLEHARNLIPLAKDHPYTGDFLSPVILHLVQKGRFDAAEKYVEIALMGAPDELRAGSHISLLKSLHRIGENEPGGLRGYWESSTVWWVGWRTYMADFGAPVSSKVAPYIERQSATRIRATEALDRGEPKAFITEVDEVLRGLRAAPKAVLDLVELVDIAADNKFEGYPEFASMMADIIHKNPILWEESEDFVRYKIGVYLADADRYEEFLKWIRVCVSSMPRDRSMQRFLAILWLERSEGRPDEVEATSNLEILLDEPQLAQREYTYSLLRSAYRRLDNAPVEIVLLKRELSDPLLDLDPEERQFLERDLERLETENVSGEMITEVVTNWLADHGLSWLNWMPPASLTDPSVPAVSDHGVYATRSLSAAQRLRYNFLLVSDETQTSELRGGALALVSNVLVQYRDPGNIDWLVDLLDEPIWTLPGKAQVVAEASRILALAGQSENAREISKRMPSFLAEFERWTSLRATINSLDFLRSESSSEWVQVFREIGARPLEQDDGSAIRCILERLTFAGEDTLVDELLVETAGFRGGVSSGQSGAALRIELTRFVRQARELRPIWQRLRDLLEENFPSSEADRENCFRFAHGNLDAWMDEVTRARAISYQMSHGLLPLGGASQLLNNLCKLGTLSELNWEIAPPLLAQLISIESADRVVANLVWNIASRVDPDRKVIREPLVAAVREFLAQPNARSRRETRRALVDWLSGVTVRTTVEEAPEDVFGSQVINTLSAGTLNQQHLKFWASRGRWDAIGELIPAMDPNTLASPWNVCCLHHYSVATGQEEELALYGEIAREQMTDRLMNQWLDPRGGRLIYLIKIYQKLGWLTDWDERIEDHELMALRTPRLRFSVELARALRTHDWSVVLEKSDMLLRLDPENYFALFHRGEALFYLGEMTAAISDLTLAASKQGDTCDRQTALALIEKARASTN